MKKSEDWKMNPDLTQRIKAVEGRQDYDEWKKAKNMKPSVHLDYTEYQRMLKAFSEIALVLDKTNIENSIPSIPSSVLTPIQDQDLITLENDVEVFDGILESDQAFTELADSLGLN